MFSIFSVRPSQPRANELTHSILSTTGVFENILGFNPSIAERIVSQTTILKWLLKRIDSKSHDDNRGYAAEILSILLQNSRENRLALGKEDGVEKMLGILSVSIFISYVLDGSRHER